MLKSVVANSPLLGGVALILYGLGGALSGHMEPNDGAEFIILGLATCGVKWALPAMKK